MKKFFLIVLAVLIVTSLCVLTTIAETNNSVDNTSNTKTTNADAPAWQVAIIYFIMFTGVSVIGVMFFKVVQKNKHP